ncbi:MAG TPA: glycosyltransferase family 2 protein [Bacteroidota bacterium]|nr:glycosyltransferase family 2 protein [Bacteroidota bacterium]
MCDLSIVIVTWNSLDHLRRCLASLKESPPQARFELIVVDNASSDGTVEFLRAYDGDVRLIANTENRGFAAANNQAFEIARGRYVLLLNPDTVVHRGALDALVQFMDARADAAAAGPALRNEDGTLQQTGVRFPNNLNILFEALFLDRLFPRSKIFGRHKELYADASVPRRVEYVQGSCMIVRSDVMRKVGGLDERFFLYFEEVDWCKQMMQAGYGVYICPSAAVTHLANVRLGHYDERRLVHYHRSLILFYQKHYSAFRQTMLIPVLLLRSFIRLCVWGLVALVRPSMRATAFSSMRGYIRTVGLLFGRKEVDRG